MKCGESPIALFFYFLPIDLWKHIAVASNDYHVAMMDKRVDDAYERQKKRVQKSPDAKRRNRTDLRHQMQKQKPVMPHELCIFIGLLVARAICPNRERLANHWKSVDEGAISRGSFGKFMPRDRFMEIARDLHFNSNSDPRAATDRAWKIRSIVDTLQATFRMGYVPPPQLSFDEAMLPSRSSFNRMRVYMKDKPHKWGTKLFMLCCAQTSYCIRYPVSVIWYPV